ncbi:MAG: LmeA family phospholipid-binding protein [Anaerolineae bacterium]
MGFKRLALLMVIASALMIAGCRGNINVQRGADGSLNVTVTLSEADVNAAITDALNTSANPLFRNPSVDLQSGQIVINGEHDRRDGGGRISGSVTVTPSVTNGVLSITVSSLNVEGLAATDAEVQAFNARIQEALARRVNRDHPNVALNAVTVSDTEMVIELNLRR